MKDYNFNYFCASDGYFKIESNLDDEVLELTGNELKNYLLENYNDYFKDEAISNNYEYFENGREY